MEEFMHDVCIFIASFVLFGLGHPIIANLVIGGLIEFFKDVFNER